MYRQKTKDHFRYKDYVLFLKNKLDTSEYSHVVWVHWDYWAWKSTTMNLLKELYQESNFEFDNILEFSAWRNYYNKEETVWKALLYELAGKIYDIFDSIDIDNYNSIIRKEIQEQKEKKSMFERILLWHSSYRTEYKEFIESIKYTCLEIQFNLYQDLKNFDDKLEYYKNKANTDPIWALKRCLISIPEAIKWEYKIAFSWIFSLLIKEEQELKKTKIDSLEVIQRKFDILLSFYELFFQDKNPLIIMVDDLDRILPEKSVEILEILRIFFEKSKKIHFICAIDIRVIEKWIERKFNQLNKWWDLSRIEMEEYLEKIITLPFDLPAIPLVDLWENSIKWLNVLLNEKYNNKEENINQIIIERLILKDYLINKKDNQDLFQFINEFYHKNNDTLEYFKNYFDKNISGIQIVNKEPISEDLCVKLVFKNKDENIEIEINDNSEIKKRISSFTRVSEINSIYEWFYNNILLNFPDFEDIIKTGLSWNPRKIERFLNVFEVYFKILLFRTDNQVIKDINDTDGHKIKDTFRKYAILLVKMLIIKLEWDEIYREFVKDKLYLIFIEKIALDINISFKINQFIKDSKKYKMQNLFWMLTIWEKFKEFWENSNLLKNIYIVYYLFIIDNYNEDEVRSNENYDNIFKFNLLKYLYENNDLKMKEYYEFLKDLYSDKEIFNQISSNIENYTEQLRIDKNLNINDILSYLVNILKWEKTVSLKNEWQGYYINIIDNNNN